MMYNLGLIFLFAFIFSRFFYVDFSQYVDTLIVMVTISVAGAVNSCARGGVFANYCYR